MKNLVVSFCVWKWLQNAPDLAASTSGHCWPRVHVFDPGIQQVAATVKLNTRLPRSCWPDILKEFYVWLLPHTSKNKQSNKLIRPRLNLLITHYWECSTFLCTVQPGHNTNMDRYKKSDIHWGGFIQRCIYYYIIRQCLEQNRHCTPQYKITGLH